MDQGGLVSDDIMVDTIRERLEENATGCVRPRVVLLAPPPMVTLLL